MNRAIEFGKQIQKMRKEQGLTLQHVADKLKIDVSMLSKIEHGERNVNSNLLKSICKIYNLDFRKFQIELLIHRISNDYGAQPFIEEAVTQFLNERSK